MSKRLTGPSGHALLPAVGRGGGRARAGRRAAWAGSWDQMLDGEDEDAARADGFLQRAEQPDDVALVDDGVDRVHAAACQRQHGGASMPGRSSRTSAERPRRGRSASGSAWGARRAPSEAAPAAARQRSRLAGGRPREQHGLRLEHGLQLDEPVLAQRLAARDEVDDRLGRAQPRGELDRAAERDELAATPAPRAARRRARIGRRDPAALEIGAWRSERPRDGQREPAAAVAELEQRLDRRPRLDDLVRAGDAEVDVAGGSATPGCRPSARAGGRGRDHGRRAQARPVGSTSMPASGKSRMAVRRGGPSTAGRPAASRSRRTRVRSSTSR